MPHNAFWCYFMPNSAMLWLNQKVSFRKLENVKKDKVKKSFIKHFHKAFKRN